MAEVMSQLQESQPNSSSIKSTSPSRIFKFKKAQVDAPNPHTACIIKIVPHASQSSNKMDMSQIGTYRASSKFATQNLDDGRQKNFEMGCYRMKMQCFDINDLKKYEQLVIPLAGSKDNFLIINVLFFDSTSEESFMGLQKYLHLFKTNTLLQSVAPLTNLIVSKNANLVHQKKVSPNHALMTAQKHNALYLEMGSNEEIEQIIQVGIALKAAQFGERYLFSPFDTWRISLSSAQREISIPPNLTQIEQEWRQAIENLLHALEQLIGFTNIHPYTAHKELAIHVIKITKQLQSSSKELDIINFSLKLVGNQKNYHNTEDSKRRKQVLTILKENEQFHNQALRQQLMVKLESLKQKSKTHQPKEIAEVCQKFATDLYSCQQMFLNEQFHSQMEPKENAILRRPGFKEKQFKQKILTQLALYKNSANHMEAVIFEIQNFENKINESIKAAEECLNGFNGFNILNMQPMLNFIDFYICKKSEACHLNLQECNHTSKTVMNDKQYINFLTQSEEVIKKNRFQCLDIVQELKQQFKQKDDKLMQIQILKHNLNIVKANEQVYSQNFKDFMGNQNILLQSAVQESNQPKKSMMEEFFNNAALKFQQLTKFKFDKQPLREEENDEKKNYKFSESDHEIGNGFAERIDGIIESSEQAVISQYEKVSAKVNEVFSNTSTKINQNLDSLAANIDIVANKVQNQIESQIQKGQHNLNELSQNISKHSQTAKNTFKDTIQDVSDSTSQIKRDIADKIERAEQTVHRKFDETISNIQRPETITTASIQSEQMGFANTIRNAAQNIENKLEEFTGDIQQNANEVKNNLDNNMKGLSDTAENFAMFEYQNIPQSIENNLQFVEQKVSEGKNSLVNNAQGIEEKAKTLDENSSEGFNSMKSKLNGNVSNGSQYSQMANRIENLSSNAAKSVTQSYQTISSKLGQQINQIKPSIGKTEQVLSYKLSNGYSSVLQTGKKLQQTITSSLADKTKNVEEMGRNMGGRIEDKANESLLNARQSAQKANTWIENVSKQIRND